MTRRALWPAGLVAWTVTAFVVGVATTPVADGCDDRAIVTAIAWGGIPAIALIGWDVVRRRKLGAGILLGWTVMWTLVAWGAAGPSADGDCDHLVALGMSATFLSLYALAIGVVASAAYGFWRFLQRVDTPADQREAQPIPGLSAAPPRKWRVEVRGSSLVITRRKPPA